MIQPSGTALLFALNGTIRAAKRLRTVTINDQDELQAWIAATETCWWISWYIDALQGLPFRKITV